jgi:uncharacterized membrane protein
MGMGYLLAGMAIFFGVHSTAIVAPGWRDQMAARLGPTGWKALYGVVSIVGFVLMVKGYNLTRGEPVPLYVPPTALRHIAAIVMLPVFPLLLATYLPGAIKRGVKHPMLTATKLFGGFLVWAVADRISLKRRQPGGPQTLPEGRFNDLIAVVAGFALYVLFVAWAHARLFGVAPMAAG